MKRRNESRREVIRALQSAERGDPGSALAMLRQIIEANPRDGEARVTQAQVQLQIEDYPAVVATASVAIGLLPSDPRGYCLRARAQQARGKLVEALTDVRHAAGLAQQDFAVQVFRGRLELAQGHVVEAADAAERAIDLDRRNPDGHRLLADVAFETQQWDVVATSAAAVLRLHRGDRRAQELLHLAQAQNAAPNGEVSHPETDDVITVDSTSNETHEPAGKIGAGIDRVSPSVEPTPVEPTPVEQTPGEPTPGEQTPEAAQQTPEVAQPVVSPVPKTRVTSEEGTEEPGRRPIGLPHARLWTVLGVVAVLGVLVLAVVASLWWLILLVVPLGIAAGVLYQQHARRRAGAQAPQQRVRALLARGMDDVKLPEASTEVSRDRPDRSRARKDPDRSRARKDPEKSRGRKDAARRTPSRTREDRLDSGVAVERGDDGLAVRYRPTSKADGGKDRVDDLLVAAEAAIRDEEWSAAEDALREVLELEPLYLSAHETLTFVLRQQQPRWLPRR